MNKFFSALLVVLFSANALAQSGLTCEDAIPVDSNYVGRVDGPCTIWYTASTYDLPLNVHFIPDANDSEWWPDVTIDLTCIPGQYDDPKVDSIIKMVEGFDISFPVELACDRAVVNGKVEWDLFVDAMYREQLAEFGVTYDVPAFVEVRFYEAGKITMKPDTAFASCMEQAEHVVLDDSIEILAEDADRVFMLPYTDWQNDSIQFVWTGKEPAYLYVASTKCDFEPEVSNSYVWARYTLKADAPVKLSQQTISDAITMHDGGGLFYGKVIASTTGKFLVEKVPMRTAMDGAIVMEYGVDYTLEKNDSTLYCFPKTWESVQFVADNETKISAFFATNGAFIPSTEDENILTYHDFSVYEGVNSLDLSLYELGEMTWEAEDDYIYVRFANAGNVTITPNEWNQSDCVNESYSIVSGKLFRVESKSSSTVYRMRYADWKGYDITIKWTGQRPMPTYFSDTCKYFLSDTDKAVCLYKNIRRPSGTITADVVDSWADRVDADGFIYVRFNPTRAGNVTFTSERPIEVLDPVYTTVKDTICYGKSLDWNGKTYSESSSYTYTTTAANGADSIVTLQLVVLPEIAPTTDKVVLEYGNTHTWHGTTYAETTRDTVVLQSAQGCDSVVILDLTILPKPLTPCEAASQLLEKGAELTIGLDSALNIYRVVYADWAQGMTLQWAGEQELHAFVAETCEFAVAPYNRYVRVYAPVSAKGELVLDADEMAALAEHVDAEGYLYLRFLTEQPGTLTVE